MENIKSNLTFNTNTNPSGLDQQAASQTSNPFGPNPFAAASPKVLQINVPASPIPVAVQNLIPSNPKERVRTILRMPASKQQDKHFCELAQNAYLDGKSRLAAAMKLKDTKKRNTILAALAKDQSLKGAIRLKAVDKIGSFRQRKEMFAALAQDQTLEEADRMEAELSIAFRIESENELHSMETSLDHKHFNAEPNAKPGVAVEAKLEPEEKVEAVQVEELVVVLAPEQPLKNNEVAPIQIDPADLERKERALLTIVQDKDVDQHLQQGSSEKSYRLEAALKLAPSQRREEALAFLAQDKEWGKVYNPNNSPYTCSNPQVYAKFRLEAALALAPSQRREETLALLAQDKDYHNNDYRLEAALALAPGQRREDVLAFLARDKKFEQNYNGKSYYITSQDRQLKAALALAPGQRKEDTLSLLAQDQDLIKPFLSSTYSNNGQHVWKNYALEAALALVPGQRREEVLALLSQNTALRIDNCRENYRLEAALSMTPGQRKEEALALLAQDKSLPANWRLDAANSMAGGQAEKEDQK